MSNSFFIFVNVIVEGLCFVLYLNISLFPIYEIHKSSVFLWIKKNVLHEDIDGYHIFYRISLIFGERKYVSLNIGSSESAYYGDCLYSNGEIHINMPNKQSKPDTPTYLHAYNLT